MSIATGARPFNHGIYALQFSNTSGVGRIGRERDACCNATGQIALMISKGKCLQRNVLRSSGWRNIKLCTKAAKLLSVFRTLGLVAAVVS